MNVSRVRGRGWGTVVGLLALTLLCCANACAGRRIFAAESSAGSPTNRVACCQA